MLKWLPAAAILALAFPAYGQPACAPSKEIEAELQKQFQERRTAMGEMQAGGVLVIYATKDGKTWTAIREMPGGIGCFLTSGTDWKAVLVGRGA